MSAHIAWDAVSVASTNVASLADRDASAAPVVPQCILSCMQTGVIDTCKSNTDFKCLCDSQKYKTSVMTCWNLRCTKAEYATGLQYITASCQAFGVTISDAAASVVPGLGPAATDLTTAPKLYSQAAFNIQAVMSSLCSLVLAVALILGFISCRNHARREREHSQRTAQVEKGLRSGRSQSYFGAAPSRPTLSTMDMDGSVDFADMFNVPRRPGPRFTNRLPITQEEGEPRFTNRLPITREEAADNIELDEKWDSLNYVDRRDSFDSGSGHNGVTMTLSRRPSSSPSTPFTATTSHTVQDYDSTAHLSPRPPSPAHFPGFTVPAPSTESERNERRESPSPPPQTPLPPIPISPLPHPFNRI